MRGKAEIARIGQGRKTHLVFAPGAWALCGTGKSGENRGRYVKLTVGPVTCEKCLEYALLDAPVGALGKVA